MFSIILFAILLLVILFFVGGSMKETERRRKQGWSRYEQNNNYSPYITKSPTAKNPTGKSVNGYTPFNPKEPSPT